MISTRVQMLKMTIVRGGNRKSYTPVNSFRQIIPPAGNSHGKGQRKTFSASLTTRQQLLAERKFLDGWHISNEFR